MKVNTVIKFRMFIHELSMFKMLRNMGIAQPEDKLMGHYGEMMSSKLSIELCFIFKKSFYTQHHHIIIRGSVVV